MKKNKKSTLRKYGVEADQHWQYEVMKLAEKYGFIVQAYGGFAIIMATSLLREAGNGIIYDVSFPIVSCNAFWQEAW